MAPSEVSSTLASFHPARPLDDYGHALLRSAGGVLAMLTVSQVSHGRLNDLTLEVDGATGSLTWRQDSPDQLIVRRHGQPATVYERNGRSGCLSNSAREACRLPGGHPEGFYEAFANLYRESYRDMRRRALGRELTGGRTAYPDVHDGLEGMVFIQQCVASSQAGGTWLPLDFT
jgi:predicted dehydrogenase